MKPIESKYNRFIFKDYSFDPQTGVFVSRYAFDDLIEFQETFTFPVQDIEMTPALDAALFNLHLAAGISYYKAYLPKEIIIESGRLSADQVEFWNKLYTLGLGEFFYRNELAFKDYIQFPISERSHGLASHAGKGALVAIGGGKDSLVSIELLKSADKEFDLFSVKTNAVIERVAKSTGKSHIVIDRKLDSRLMELEGAWNGHVPITAINMFAATALAIIMGKKDVIFSNERSANVGNVAVDGVEVNHQFSKSFEFEKMFQKYTEQNICSGLRVFSLLRPWSELKIVQQFFEQKKYFDIFTSCNKNFKIFDGMDGGWCCDCPKCAFVFSMLAAFAMKDELEAMFGQNVFADRSLIPLFRELFGLEEAKPFECVGEPEEMIVAFAMAHERGDFEESCMMKLFVEEVLPGKDVEMLKSRVLESSSEHLIPEEYKSLI